MSQSGLDPLFADMLSGAVDKFGSGNVYVAGEHEKNISTIPCPLAFGWQIGGTNGVPIGRVYGTDGPPGSYKTCLALEIQRWFLLCSGFAVFVHTEDKMCDTMLTALMTTVPVRARKNQLLANAKSLEEWQSHCLYWNNKARELKKMSMDNKLTPEQRIPMTVAVDSLTGQDTETSKAKIEKEGSAKARGFSEQAMSISRFYKAWSVDGALLSLYHVQHSKVSQNDDDYGDDAIIPNGGTEPKYASSFHIRMLSVSQEVKADGHHVLVRTKCIRSGLGDSKRFLMMKIRWNYVWRDMPSVLGDEIVLSDKEVSWGEMSEWVDSVEPFLTPTMYDDVLRATGWSPDMSPEVIAAKIADISAELGDESVKLKKADIKASESAIEALTKQLDEISTARYRMPETEERQVQSMWFDWDWSLGWLLHDMQYSSKEVNAEMKRRLKEIVQFSEGNKYYVKSASLFGDDKQHSFTEFGKAIREDEDLYAKLEAFLGIRRYRSHRDVKFYPTDFKKSGKGKAISAKAVKEANEF